MCYAYESLDQPAVNVCHMCKVFPHPRCPHIREICRNRAAHPKFDVLYLKNAEVDSFNGCGYCKWARIKAARYFNTGWPGCCRAPKTSERRLIQPADWRSVSLVHHIPIPPDIKAALDSVSRLSRGTGSPIPSASPVRSGASIKVDSRRNSTSGRSSAKSTAIPIPSEGRAGDSPQMVASSIMSTSSRGSGSNGGTARSMPNASSTEQGQARQQHDTHTDSEKPPGSNWSPSRKHVNFVTPPRNSGTRPPASAAKVVADALTSSRHRSNSSPQPSASTKVPSLVPPQTSSPPVRSVDAPKAPKKANPQTSTMGICVSETLTESAGMSIGAFTDYLSDESEEELQRQAEAKAALVAQNEAEEIEFNAARQALRNIGLRPPKSWTTTTATDNSSADIARATARTVPLTRS
ncbi:hypothetical protein C8R45DRAFT_360457 [Mycena sanguinolenta]|nr:hypothetical protein C8R45DRAFT_360457 [Mycena sanguinolenta]